MDRLKEYLNDKTQQEMATLLGVRQPTLQAWLAEKRPIPIKRCVQIEELTQGLVTRRDLRPDDWAEIWPELAQPESKEI